MIGFSAGGRLAYLTACRLPINSTVVLYGGWLPTADIPMSQPTPTLDLTPGITGQVLYLFGEDEALIDARQRDQIRTALEGARINHELIGYPNTQHAFFWPGRPMFNPEARDDAWAGIRRAPPRLAARWPHRPGEPDATPDGLAAVAGFLSTNAPVGVGSRQKGTRWALLGRAAWRGGAVCGANRPVGVGKR